MESKVDRCTMNESDFSWNCTSHLRHCHLSQWSCSAALGVSGFPEGHLTTFVSIVMGVPQLFVREHPIKYIKLDDLGLPPFMETSIVVFPEYVRNYGRPRPSTSWWFPAGSYIVSTG